jgi:ABC-type glutathione transport system ATPase component
MYKIDFFSKVAERAAIPPLKQNENKPLVILRAVKKIYQGIKGGFTALIGISAEFHAGEFVGIMDKSGAGKTTLVNLITGIDHIFDELAKKKGNWSLWYLMTFLSWIVSNGALIW